LTPKLAFRIWTGRLLACRRRFGSDDRQRSGCVLEPQRDRSPQNKSLSKVDSREREQYRLLQRIRLDPLRPRGTIRAAPTKGPEKTRADRAAGKKIQRPLAGWGLGRHHERGGGAIRWKLAPMGLPRARTAAMTAGTILRRTAPERRVQKADSNLQRKSGKGFDGSVVSCSKFRSAAGPDAASRLAGLMFVVNGALTIDGKGVSATGEAGEGEGAVSLRTAGMRSRLDATSLRHRAPSGVANSRACARARSCGPCSQQYSRVK